MAETLAHDPLLDPRLEGQGLGGGDAELVARVFRRFDHSVPAFRATLAALIFVFRYRLAAASAHCRSPELPARKRARRAARAMKVSHSRPASSAACTTFDRPKAKSNCAEVNASMTAISWASPAGRRRKAAASFRTPSSRRVGGNHPPPRPPAPRLGAAKADCAPPCLRRQGKPPRRALHKEA